MGSSGNGSTSYVASDQMLSAVSEKTSAQNKQIQINYRDLENEGGPVLGGGGFVR